MKNRLLTLAGGLALLAVLGKFYAAPAFAQVRAALVQDVDQPARQPFQYTVSQSLSNFSYTSVPIPAGKRLIVDFIAVSGAAISPDGPIQAITLLQAGQTGNPAATYYFKLDPSTTTPTQVFYSGPTKIYADTLSIGMGFSGFSPSTLNVNTVISGHLISIP